MSASLPFSDRALQPGETDLLGRGGFVRNLATILCNAPKGDSIVFALYGKWGEGKTSTLTLLEQEFSARATNEETVPVVIRFNPWVFSGREHLFNAFFEDIGNAIGSSPDPKLQEAAKKWKRMGAYSDLAGSALGGIDAALNLFGVAVPGGRIASSALRKLGSTLDAAAQADENASVPSLADLRRGLEETLLTLAHPILVILDDLDRLPPNELVEIFQLLKSTVDLPNVHYLLLCDRGNIERSLKKQKLRPDYLEKIVQFSAPLPAVPSILLHRLLIDQLQAIFAEFAGDDYRLSTEFWENLAAGELPQLFSTLRDVKRYVGELRLALPVFCRDGHFELNPDHFLKLQALRLLAPHIVEEIYSRRALFVPKNPSFYLRDEDLKQNTNARKVFVQEELPEKIKKLENPNLENLLQGLLLSGGVDWTADDGAAEGRFLTSALWFDCYFTLEVPSRAVQMNDVAAIEKCLSEHPDRIDGIIGKIQSENGCSALVRCLTTNLEPLIVSHGHRILVAMLSPDADLEDPKIRLFEPGIDDYFARWVDQLPKQEQTRKIIELIRESRNHEFFSGILYRTGTSQGSKGGLFNNLKDSYESLGRETAKLIETKAEGCEPLLHEEFWRSYDVWFKWGSRGTLREWVRKETETDLGFKEYISAMGNFRTSHDGHGNESEDFWIHYSRLSTFPSLKKGRKLCRRLAEAATTKEDRLLFSCSEDAFKEQADFRRGKRVLFRKFPELPQLRLLDPNFINGLHENSAMLFDRSSISGPTVHSLEEKISQCFGDFPPPLTPLVFTTEGGTTNAPALLFGSELKDVIELARECDHAYVLNLFHDGQILAIGLNGEGRIFLGTLKELAIKTKEQK